MSELYHYGVKGMKWGVRTSVYTNNRIGDNYTDRQKKRMTSEATNLLRREVTRNRTIAGQYEKAATKNYKKADKHTWTSEKAQSMGDQQKFQKYQGKAWQQLAKQHVNLEAAKTFTNKANIANKHLSDISSGKLQAGRDFVTNHTVSTNLLLSAAGIINVRRTTTIDKD